MELAKGACGYVAFRPSGLRPAGRPRGVGARWASERWAATARAGRELSRVRLLFRTGDRAAITAGAQGLIQAVGALPDGNDVRRACLDTLHDEVKSLCDHGPAEQIDRAVLACQSAVAAAPPSDPGLLARLLVDEAMALLTRFERTGVAADLVAMTDARCRAADVVPTGDPVRGQVLQIAASGLLMRFQLLHTAADLDPAIDFGRAALADDPLDRATALSNLGLTLRFRYEQRGDPADLTAAVRDGEQATTAAPADDPRLASYLSNYSSALLMRFEQLGGQGDLQAALTAGGQALAAAQRDDPARVPACLTTRAIALRFEAARTLAQADIESAVDAARHAAARLDTDPAALTEIGTDHVSNLSLCLLLRYETGGGTQDDLDQAIRQSKRAADLGGPQRRQVPDELRQLLAAQIPAARRGGRLGRGHRCLPGGRRLAARGRPGPGQVSGQPGQRPDGPMAAQPAS